MDAFICHAVRSPIGRHGGILRGKRADDLAADIIREVTKRIGGMATEAIDDVILGCANQAGEDNRNVARMASLLAGLPIDTPGVTVNRLCASGAEAVAQACRAVRCGDASLIVAGGVESMTRSPYVLAKAENPFSRAQSLEDTTIGWRFANPAMAARYGTASMPQTAENVSRKFGVSREAQDLFAEQSQRRAARAQSSGYFRSEIVPVPVSRKGVDEFYEVDEHLRPGTDFAALQKLRPIVDPNGSITAGNSSGVNDGAAAMIVASRSAVSAFSLEPRARLLGGAVAGVEPDFMGLGPIAATRKLLSSLDLRMADFDVIEINEAFAAQVIACLRELGVDPADECVNPNGGAIALGHPLGMSGARLIQTAIHMLGESHGRRALVTMCVGVGQGLSLAFERV